jgi:hypothetical protein
MPKELKAVYYNASLEGKTFDIMKHHADGTVDIGTGDKVVVKSCPVSEEAKHGYVTLGAEPLAPREKQVPPSEVITEEEIQAELESNPQAGNDYFKARALIEYRRVEKAKGISGRIVGFRQVPEDFTISK